VAEVHDAARGRGAFEGALRGIRALQHHGVPVGVRVTLYQHNLHDLEATARLLLDDLQLPAFSINAAGYLGSCQQHAGEILLDPAGRSQAMRSLLDLQRRYPGRITASAGPLADAHHWSEMIRASRQRAPAFPQGGRLTACGCPFSEITVRPDGVIVPCSMLAHLALGRMNQDALDEVWQSSPALNRLRGRRQIPLTRFALCQGCAYTPYCTGNCPGLAYTLTGQVDAPSPDACLRQFLADGGSLPEPAQDLAC
jgi:SynChlorMet cassette radical SAM/SPASM protein ScmE